MKKIFSLFSCAALSFFCGAFAEEISSGDYQNEYQEIVIDDPSEISSEKASLTGTSQVPAAKRPKSPDAEKSRAAAEKDKDGEDEKRRETIQFGTESEITSLVPNSSRRTIHAIRTNCMICSGIPEVPPRAKRSSNISPSSKILALKITPSRF